MVLLILLFLFCIFYWFTLFDPFLPSFKFFNARYNFPSIFLDFLFFFCFLPFNLSLRLSYLFFRLLMECCSYAYSFPAFLRSLLELFVLFFNFFKEKFKTSTFHNTLSVCVCRSENSTLINLFCFPSLFFHLLLVLELLLLSVCGVVFKLEFQLFLSLFAASRFFGDFRGAHICLRKIYFILFFLSTGM